MSLSRFFRNELRHFTCDHTFNFWHVVPRVLVSPFGRTVDDVQQRECTKCGYHQRTGLKVENDV